MAKTKTKQPTAIDVLILDYQLAELPSSQHRSGLAGLVLIIRWLQRQPEFQQKVENGAICRLTRLDDRGATLELNKTGLEILFDEIYAASPEEQERNQLLKNQRTKEVIQPLREEEKEETDPKTNKKKTKKVYIYPVVVPKGSFLSDSSYDSSSDGKNGLWIKLWRDMVWSILRGVPATRKPFEARTEGQYNEDAIKVWQQLIQPEEFTVDLPSTYFLGAQANNAENTPFKDRARFQFLLHFWLFTAQIYVPQFIDNEGNRNFVGYAIAIPDVAYLEWFCDELLDILSDRGVEKSGYRPRDCIVDLAIESALDTMKRLRDRLTQTIGEKTGIASTVFGIDVIHTEKQGNNIRLLNVTRIDPEEAMLDRYAQIRDNYWSPLFRKQRLLNLVNHSPWYSGFDSLLCTLPYELITENEYFQHDVREAFNHEESIMAEEIATVAEVNIEKLVFRLVENYVRRKLKAKYNLEWKEEWKLSEKSTSDQKEARNKLGYGDYAEKKAKIAKSAFLDVRSRTEKIDFINYFASSLCSVPQYMKSDDYVSLTKALYDDTDRIRTLTLLALSANS
ncbi:MAG: type I-MYXAN CRISPR-associated protein Cmx8 [Cyanosarcina radialis HA8281-LM2]|nr:type I-MYXAN CRISPR-associated protein Cmx8 [Cyanosarcina radialis HA8281-LM2]